MNRPFVLSVAGHDPCGGAGLNADIKTFEANEVNGLSVVTGLTVQNDSAFEDIMWVSAELIKKQIEILFRKYEISLAKIGIVENIEMLSKIVQILKKCNAEIKIIWDPIVKSSSGFLLNNLKQIDKSICKELYLTTPNKMEYRILKEAGFDFSHTNYLLKGGHDELKRGTDILFCGNDKTEIQGASFNGKSKHGTGCVLSSAIASNLAKGYTIVEACKHAKKYVEEFILSNDGNLGYHHITHNMN